jgi:hypothetical protein
MDRVWAADQVVSAMSSPPVSPGLCASCTHAQTVASPKGSTFTLCRLSFTDPRFAKYPRLPVLVCSGYQPAAS